MTVYVDDAEIAATVGKHTSKWSHLTADTSTELDRFAASIGLNTSWIQYAGTPLEHYDITLSKRTAALRNGAIPITSRESGYQVMSKSNGIPFDLEEVREFRDSLSATTHLSTKNYDRKQEHDTGE